MLGIREYRMIYDMLDKVSPLPYDCGSLCGSICCRDIPEQEELYIYLLPGEKEFLEEEGSTLVIEKQSTGEHYLPVSWGRYVYIAHCPGPEGCERGLRPIQCRTFPLEPHMTNDGILRLIYNDVCLPYSCPIIMDRMELSDDFIECTYEAWNRLIRDDAIKDMVIMDSKNRKNCQIIR